MVIQLLEVNHVKWYISIKIVLQFQSPLFDSIKKLKWKIRFCPKRIIISLTRPSLPCMYTYYIFSYWDKLYELISAQIFDQQLLLAQIRNNLVDSMWNSFSTFLKSQKQILTIWPHNNFCISLSLWLILFFVCNVAEFFTI